MKFTDEDFYFSFDEGTVLIFIIFCLMFFYFSFSSCTIKYFSRWWY